ncbi:hypothetical protein OH802_03605 [Nocardioides sp. NBC_00850]|uniref:hypothetical protein n=1 Tax=Nocardioides sp. NBC_00850 TaxID=2976001 RepID=UPI0038643FE6|nr:hypothetical protein OH802_03605 [Nocardioides sp. NBC_00850]
MSDQQSIDQASVRSPASAIERPKTLRLAVIGMWIGAALAGFSVLVVYVEMLAIVASNDARLEEKYGDNYVRMDSLSEAGIWMSVGIAAAWAVVEIALWITMAFTNRNGFGWARIAATAMGAMGLVFAVGNFALSIAQENLVAVSVAYNLANQTLTIVIVVLLWLPASTAYYSAKKYERATKVVAQR